MAGLFFLGVFLGKFWGQCATLIEGQERLNKLMDSLQWNAEKEGSWAGTMKEEVIYIAKFGAKAHTSRICQGLKDAAQERIKEVQMCRFCTRNSRKER